MTRRIMKYNPAFLTSDELIGSFVVRHAELELTLETIRHNTGDSNQHILIIGPRGVGKTMLVLRAVAEVRRDAELKQRWFPIVFGEDSYEVCSPGEFWLEALFHLGEQTKSEKWRQIYREMKLEQDEIRLRERALAQLMDFADEQNKRILLVVENLNMILGEQIDGDDAWVLRHTLQNEPRLMLLGTATSRFNELHNYGKAMYELFKVHDLEPLNTDDCRTMWHAITGEELSEARVRPIKILTGGNPRLLSIIAKFAAKISLRELMLDLTELVDEHTEYFKSHLEGLPPLERKVFVALVDLWDPLTASEVGKAARVSVNKTSSLLNRLISRGAVVVFETQGRKKFYQVAERMYNIYHLMRRRGGPSSRIGAVVNFMIHFYESDLLVRAVASMAGEACRLDGGQRQDHYQAYETILQKIQPKELQEKILRSTPVQFFEIPDIPSTIKESLDRMKSALNLELPPEAQSYETTALLEKEAEIIAPAKPLDAASWIARGDELRQTADRLLEAEKSYREAIKLDEENAEAWAHLAELIHTKTTRFEEAEAAYRKAIELKPDYDWAWARLGRLLHEKLERFEEAEAAYRKVIELKPDHSWAWAQLGLLLHEKLERFDEAEAAYRKAIELKPDYDWAWAQLGLLLRKLERFEEAEAAYRKSIELKPGYDWAWAQLGQLLQKLERFTEAEAAYRKAIELKPDYDWAWAQLGQLLQKLERFEEAEASYRKAIELKPGYDWAWAQLAQLLQKLERFEEAEAAYRKAIELKPDYDWAWALLGLLLQELERFEEAEAAYRKAIELDPCFDWAWAQLGQLMQKLERFEEAEAAYRKVIELKPDDAWAWTQLGQLLHEKLERFDEAEAAYRKAIELKPDYTWTWTQLGQLLHEKLERFDEAEAAYRKAIELKPDYTWTWTQLGQLLHEKLERFDEAEAAYRKAIELKPVYTWTWAQLGLLMRKLERFEEAVTAFRNAIKFDPYNPWSIWAVVGLLLHEKLGRFEEAQQAYLTALELDDTHYFVWEQLILLQMLALNDPDLALKTAQNYLEGAKRTPASLRNVASTFVEQHRPELYPQAGAWIQEAIEKAPEESPDRIVIASLLGGIGQWKDAIDIASQFLKNTDRADSFVGQLTDFFINAAASDYAEEVLTSLEKTPGASILEPLVAGLQIFLGEEPVIAQEILEVGRDVAERIEMRKQQTSPAAAKVEA